MLMFVRSKCADLTLIRHGGQLLFYLLDSAATAASSRTIDTVEVPVELFALVTSATPLTLTASKLTVGSAVVM